MTQTGSCPTCGAPIYTPRVWFGILPPLPEYTCLCNNIVGLVETFTTDGSGNVTMIGNIVLEPYKENLLVDEHYDPNQLKLDL